MPTPAEPSPEAKGGAIPADGERGFELSLNLLTALVLVALAASVVTLVYRVVAPRFFSEHDNGPARVTVAPPKPMPAASDSEPEKGDEVLMDPRHVFRCEEQGRVTFSDRACAADAAPKSGSP